MRAAYRNLEKFGGISSNYAWNAKVRFSQQSSKVDERLEKRRNEIMNRGLPKVKPIPDVKDIILVSSGKGGVGKTTTAVNLATALKLEFPEKSIGLLDADVFGPSVPLMMNLDDTPILNDNNLMEPLINYEIKCMSMGFLVGEGSPLIWRGLMVMQALEKLMRQVQWGPTDYLIVDTPPGTGDTHLTLIQNLPITGAVLVTTPQSAAMQVTKRGAVMFEKMNVPIIGIVENMSSVQCPACSSDVQLFGNGVQDLAEEIGTSVLLQVPLQKDINSGSDKGLPITVSKPNSNETLAYKTLARRVKTFVDTKGNKS